MNVLSNPANTRAILARSCRNSSEFQRGMASDFFPALRLRSFFVTALLGERAPLETQLANPATLLSLVDSLAK